jgi:hypothetical protein
MEEIFCGIFLSFAEDSLSHQSLKIKGKQNTTFATVQTINAIYTTTLSDDYKF